MPANLFSAMIDQDISRFRRVAHSGTQYFKSIDRSSFGLNNALNAASTFAGTAGGVGGAMAIGMSATAAGAVAGAGFLAAVAGPQVAVTAAVIGLALLIKGAYSNREAAHKKLKGHVWTMVCDVQPEAWTPDGLAAACEASMTLMDDGKNQIKLLGNKLSAAQSKFAAFNAKFEALRIKWVQGNAIAGYTGGTTTSRAGGSSDAAVAKKAMLALWNVESKSGGAIFEYVRRLSHTSNYLQAPGIIALAMKQRLRAKVLEASPSGAPSTNVAMPDISVDFFSDVPSVKDLRKALDDLSKFYEDNLK
jgi:hypothetical protein